MRVNGRHAHAFFNPAGIAYELRCFRTAPGISAEGAPTGEFSWFPGCRWQIALCARLKKPLLCQITTCQQLLIAHQA